MNIFAGYDLTGLQNFFSPARKLFEYFMFFMTCTLTKLKTRISELIFNGNFFVVSKFNLERKLIKLEIISHFTVICLLQVSQMALINSAPENCQSKLEITIFILVGCLGK